MGRSGHPARWAGTTPMCPPGAVRRWPGPLLLLAWLWRWLWLPTGLLLAATGAAQAATYTSASTPYSWVDPGGHAKIGHNTSPYKFTSAGCGSAPPTLDDAISGLIPIGFSFVFGGSTYTQLRVQTNGRVQFNNTTCGYGTDGIGPPQTYPYGYPDAAMNTTMKVFGVDLDPTNAAYLDSLGWVHYRLGNLEIAEQWLRRALQLGEPDGTVLAHLGEVLVAKGAQDEARLVLRQALERLPESPERVRTRRTIRPRPRRSCCAGRRNSGTP